MSLTTDKITYKVCSSNFDKREAAELALECSLYVRRSEYQLRSILLGISTIDSPSWEIVMAFHGSTPVGIMLLATYGHIISYVKTDYRRRGVATGMFKKMKKATNKSYMYAYPGIQGSESFWKSLDIQVY